MIQPPSRKVFEYFIIITFLVFSTTISFSQQSIKRTDSNNIPYLEYLPTDYLSNPNKEYPVIIFLHGTGERGDGSNEDVSKVTTHGPPKHIKNGHKMEFTVDGKNYAFIVITPQLVFGNGNWRSDYIDEVYTHVMNTYRVDRNRVYLTGLSLGGGGVWRYGGDCSNVWCTKFFSS